MCPWWVEFEPVNYLRMAQNWEAKQRNGCKLEGNVSHTSFNGGAERNRHLGLRNLVCDRILFPFHSFVLIQETFEIDIIKQQTQPDRTMQDNLRSITFHKMPQVRTLPSTQLHPILSSAFTTPARDEIWCVQSRNCFYHFKHRLSGSSPSMFTDE